jgi:anti-sigma factor RsiW
VGGLICKAVILEYLDRYLDATLDAALVLEFEKHLAACPACVAYLRTYAKTRELVGRTVEVGMPPEMETLVRRFLGDQLGNGHA